MPDYFTISGAQTEIPPCTEFIRPQAVIMRGKSLPHVTRRIEETPTSIKGVKEHMLGLLKHLPTILPLIVATVKSVEALLGGGAGESKRALVVEFVKLAILAAEGVTGKDIVDEELFAEGVGDIVDGVVAILNSTGKFGNDDDEPVDE